MPPNNMCGGRDCTRETEIIVGDRARAYFIDEMVFSHVEESCSVDGSTGEVALKTR
jgi:hypothetical protein